MACSETTRASLMKQGNRPGGAMRNIRETVAVVAVLISLLGPDGALCSGDDSPPDADSIRLSLDGVLHKLSRISANKEAPGCTRAQAAQAAADLTGQLKAIAAYEHGERELKGDVGGGFSGDEAPIEVRRARGAADDDPRPVITSNADPASNYKIDSTVTVTRGSYPQRFRLSTSVGVLLSGKKFQEDVSNLLFSYGHYTTSWAEVYGFAERISDSYLSIDQRWEVGGGTFLSWKLGLTKAAARDLVPLCSDPSLTGQVTQDARVRSRNGWHRMTGRCLPRRRGFSLTPPDPQLRPAMEAAWWNANHPGHRPVAATEFSTNHWDPVERTVYPAIFDPTPADQTTDAKHDDHQKEAEAMWFQDEDRAAAAPDLYALRQLRENAIRSIEQRGARLTLGVAISALSEVERSSINALIDRDSKQFVPVGGPNTETKSVTLDGAHVFRISARPTVRLRPSTHLFFEALMYAKQRVWPGRTAKSVDVDKRTRKATVRTVNDLRIDAHSELRYILVGADTLGGEKFGVVASYDFHKDTAPPFLASQTLVDQGILGFIGDGLSARQKHHVFKIQLTVGWGG
jgi:hypothetical protein